MACMRKEMKSNKRTKLWVAKCRFTLYKTVKLIITIWKNIYIQIIIDTRTRTRLD